MNDAHTAWQDVALPRFAPIEKDTRCDVVVVGGGITGLTAAYLLKRAGKRVCLLERDRLGGGDTGRTTAHLTQVTDLRLSKLVDTFGRDSARLVWLGGAAAINTIEQLSRAEEIDCDFQRVPGFLHQSLVDDADESESLADDARLAQELGFEANYLPQVPLMKRPGVRFANQARFHPLRYLAGLARAVHGDNGEIFEQSEATDFEDDPRVVKSNGCRIECDYIVIATHVPLVGEGGLIGATLMQTKLAPYSSYAVGATAPRGALPEASFWDTTDPYYYLRIDRRHDHDYAIFGGQDHKTGQADDTAERFERLERLLKQIVPQASVDRRWSGQVVETHDGLPYIGETAERQFAATGFSGNGMTFGTLAAMMACDYVLSHRNPWQDLFDVNRKKLAGAWDYVKENFDFPYYLLRDRLRPAEGESTRDVKPGEGKIIRIDGKRVACSRDAAGNLTAVSAICTHMGCVVNWNGAESTWDCPCHGSRFRATGEVLGGPAESPLPAVDAGESTSEKSKTPRRRSSAVSRSDP